MRPDATRHVLLFDGTGNDSHSDTNVYRLYRSLSRTDARGMRQECYYRRGVGVGLHELIPGGGFGFRLSGNIRRAYQHLARTHRDGDDVVVFGFSRGAFTAMGLLGLLAWRGLPHQGHAPGEREALACRAYEQYVSATQAAREHNVPGARALEELVHLSNAERARLERADRCVLDEFRRVPVRFVGLFDSVRAAGLEVFKWAGRRLPEPVGRVQSREPGTLVFRYTRHLAPNVERAFHALAIDEHRAVFAPRLWIVPLFAGHTPEGRLVEQRWFAGAHANVGGGYRDDPLASIPLRWMQGQAAAACVAFDETVAVPADVHTAPRADGSSSVRDSYGEWGGGLYKLISHLRYERPIDDPSVPYERQTVDPTVFERVLQVDGYRPGNLRVCLDRWLTSVARGATPACYLPAPHTPLLSRCAAVLLGSGPERAQSAPSLG
jgi:uncharacterized protein (DUF2235 family)